MCFPLAALTHLVCVAVHRARVRWLTLFFQGKIALHQILTEASVVRYWEEFGTIAFDPAHDTLLTACELKSPIDEGKAKTKSKEIKCCFSLKIRRDDAKM